MSAYYGISVLRARGGVSDRASARLPGLLKFAETGTVVCASIGSQRRVEVDGGVSAHRRSTPGAHKGVGDMGGCRKDGGASPLCSIARYPARSAASSGQRAWSRLKTSIALAMLRP